MGTNADETSRRCSDQAKLATTFATPMQAGFLAHQLTPYPLSMVRFSIPPRSITGSDPGREMAHSYLNPATPAQ